jgi:hypothetical protein
LNDAFMPIGERRGLTDGEMRIARSMFGDELDYPRIRIWQVPRLGFAAMVPFGDTILFSKWRAPRDFSRASLDAQGWLIHELTHCWQARRGRTLAFAKLGALGFNAYSFSCGGPFASYNIEQQAEIARALFHARAGEPVSGAQTDQLEALWRARC